MVKKIQRRQQKVPAVPLPFIPTKTPGHEHVLSAAEFCLMAVQTLFEGNPMPVITALKAAEHAYIKAIGKEGMSEEGIEDAEVLGIQLSAILLAKAEKAKKQAESNILTRDTGIVGPDGNPIVHVPSAPEQEPETTTDAPDIKIVS